MKTASIKRTYIPEKHSEWWYKHGRYWLAHWDLYLLVFPMGKVLYN